MRVKIALTLVAALVLTVPGAALAHKGGHGAIKHQLRDHAKKHVRHKIDHRLDRAWRRHVDRHRHKTWELGEAELLLTGHGKLGSRTVEQPADAVSTFRAWRSVLKIWALSDDVKVECKGRGYKRSWTKRDGTVVTKCKGIGNATVSGSNYVVYFRARLGQAKFPADSKGTIHTWGRWFAGPEMDDDPDDVTLDENPAEGKGGDKPSDTTTDGAPADGKTDSPTEPERVEGAV